MSTENKAKKISVVVLIWFLIAGAGLGIRAGYKWITREKLEEETGSVSLYKEEVVVYADSFSGYCLLRKAAESKDLKKAGIKLVVKDDSDNKDLYSDRLKALRDGKADMAVFTIDAELAAGIKMGEFSGSIVCVIDETKNADAIVVKGDIKSIQDLNRSDAKFVLIPGTPNEFLARIAKAYFNLSKLPKDWIIEADNPEDVLKIFRQDSGSEPRAYVFWEPYVSQACEEGGTLAFGSGSLKSGIVDVLVVGRKFLKENPEIVKAIVKACLSTAYVYKDNMVDLVIEDAKSFGQRLSRKDAENVVSGIQWKNTLENYAHFGLLNRQEAQGLEHLEDIISKIGDVLVTTGVFSQSDFDKVKISSLFYTGIIQELQRENFHPGKLGGIISGSQESLDKVRGSIKLPSLTDEQWEKLIPVAQMNIEKLEFRRGTSELSEFSKRRLEKLATRLKSLPLYYLQVIGNARAEGNIEANKALAKARAEVTAQYLILRLGVKRNRVKAIGTEPSFKSGSAQSVTFQLLQRSY